MSEETPDDPSPNRDARGRFLKGPPPNPHGSPHVEEFRARMWQKGQSGNPGGKTSEQKRREMENAEAATRIRGNLLASLDAHLGRLVRDADAANGGAHSEVAKLMTSEVVTLLRDSETRGLGAPQQSVSVSDASGTDEEILDSVRERLRNADIPEDQIAAIMGE